MEDGRLIGVEKGGITCEKANIHTVVRRSSGRMLSVAYLSGITQPPLPPAFSPPTNPYPNGIYAEGMVESDQPSGENINVYPEVSGTVKQILVAEGQEVKKGTVLLVIDDSIQRATVEQLQSQAQAAFTLLDELKAQPRKETLDVAEAQVVSAQAALKTAQDALDKQQAAYDLNPEIDQQRRVGQRRQRGRNGESQPRSGPQAARPDQSRRLDLRHR